MHLTATLSYCVMAIGKDFRASLGRTLVSNSTMAGSMVQGGPQPLSYEVQHTGSSS